MTISLRTAEDTDQEFLRDLYASTRADEMAMVPWSEAEKRTFLDMQCEAQYADYSSRFPSAEHSIVLIDGNNAGRIWIDRRPDEIRLLDIAMLPEHQNVGVGAELLVRLQGEVTRAGIALRHSVARGNDDAMRFYKRLGFEVVEEWDMHDLMEWMPAGL